MAKKYLDNAGLSYFYGASKASTTQVDAIFDKYDTTSVFLIASTTAWQTNPYCYVWNNAQQQSYKSWYGEAMELTNMTYSGYPIYKYTYPTESYDKCIFTQDGSHQTANLTAEPGKAYNPTTDTWVDIRTNPLVDKLVSINGLVEYDVKIKEYIDSAIVDTLGGSY